MRVVTPTATTRDVIAQFNAAVNRHDVAAMMSLMAEDCIFENTYPSPDGERFVGQATVRHFWEEFFHASPHARFQTEELIVHGQRGVVRWCYAWTNADGTQGHVRGVDIFRVRAGKIAEKLAYVKG